MVINSLNQTLVCPCHLACTCTPCSPNSFTLISPKTTHLSPLLGAGGCAARAAGRGPQQPPAAQRA